MKFYRAPQFRLRNDKKSHPRAFTLIELMVAIVIFSLVIAAIYATWMLIMRATQVGQTAAARAQRQRVAMGTLENSLMCVQSFQASPQYYSFIVVNGQQPVLSFAAHLPADFPRSSKFIDVESGKDFSLRRVTFTVEPGADQKNDLVLRQQPILMDVDPDEQKSPLILAHDVKNFSVECWDTNQTDWVDEWDNTNALPPMVRVELVLGSDNQDSSADADSQRTIQRVFSLPSGMLPQVIQNGSAAAFGAQRPAIPPPIRK